MFILKENKMQQAARDFSRLWILFTYNANNLKLLVGGGVKSSQWKHSPIRLREYKTLALHCPDQARKALVYFFSFVFFPFGRAVTGEEWND